MSFHYDTQSESQHRSLSSNVRRLQNAINVVLENEERTSFVEALNAYHTERDVVMFVKHLKPILNTQIKVQLLPLIKKVIPKSDVLIFDQCIESVYKNKHNSDPSSTQRSRRQKHVIHPSTQYPDVAFAKSSRNNKLKTHTMRTDRSGLSRGSNIDGTKTFRSETSLYNRRRTKSGSQTPRSDVSRRSRSTSTAVGSGLHTSRTDVSRPSTVVGSGVQTPRTDVSSRSKRTNFSNVTIMHPDPYTHKPNKSHSKHSSKAVKSAIHSPQNPQKMEQKGPNLKNTRVSKAGSIAALSSLGPKQNEVLRVYLGQPPTPDEGFGFSIRGGSEFGLGIYISLVDKGGLAEQQGLQPGDLIMEVNDISFKKITHDEVVKIIKAARRLELVVCRVGRIPGSFEVHQMYKWVDPYGRAVSPPPELEQIVKAEAGSTAGRKSGLLLLKGTDERKVNLVVEDRDILGLMIRGGLEFGLGIYISGVDPHSVAENAGLKVGDQILDVNGQSFLDMTHAEAVRILKTSKHMMLTIKDVGKLPYARTTIDKTQWINKEKISRPPSSQSRSLAGSQLSKSTTTLSSNSTLTPATGFSKGAGSQLMLSSLATSKWDMIEEAARHQLNNTEQGTLRYYLNEYQRDQITIEGLVLALSELLNTHAKFTLMTEIRSIVHAKDLDKFDTLIHRRELEARQAKPSDLFSMENLNQHLFDQVNHPTRKKKKRTVPARPTKESDSSSYPSDYTPTPTPRGSRYTTSYSSDDTPKPTPRRHLQMKKVITESDLEPLRLAIEQIDGDPDSLPDNLPQDMYHSASVQVKSQYDLSPLPSSSSQSSIASDKVPDPSNLSSPEERLSLLTDSKFLYRGTTAGPMGRSSEDVRPRSPQQISTRPHSPLSQWSLSSRATTNQKSTHPSPGLTSNHNSLRPQSPNTMLNPQSRPQTPILIVNQIATQKSQSPRPMSRPQSPNLIVNQVQGHSRSPSPSLIRNQSPRRSPSPRRTSSPRRLSRSQSPNLSRNNTAGKSFMQRQISRPLSPVASHNAETLGFKERSLLSPGMTANPLYRQTEDDFQFSPATYTLRTPPGVSSHDLRNGQEMLAVAEIHHYNKSADNHSPDDDSGVDLNGSSRHDNASHHEQVTICSDNPIDIDDALSARSTSTFDRHELPPSWSQDLDLMGLDINEEAILIAAAREKYGDIPLEVIAIHKTKPTLGLAIEGGANTRQPLPRVISIQPGGSAFESGRLKTGQIILEVNGQSLAGMEHFTAAKAIAEAFKYMQTSHMELLVTDSNVLLSGS